MLTLQEKLCVRSKDASFKACCTVNSEIIPLILFTVLTNPPKNLTAVALDPHTVNVTWSPINDTNQNENITNYYIFYRKVNDNVGRWQTRGVPLANASYNLTRLSPKTWYTIRMTTSMSHGNGPATDEVFAQTPEGGMSLKCSLHTLKAYEIMLRLSI